ncbi:MAG TPA: adenylate/guanylate cyclase domain-containing protein, partial [Herpetosiphonaceae bacterium]
WREGTLMFTDLAGFTPLMEASARLGRVGAERLLGTLNAYFAAMLEIISKAGGNLLEFTGDAMLVQFDATQRGNETAKAVRAGLRMQRAMQRFAAIETARGPLALGMRVGIHAGRFLAADIGTPRRMEHVLLGATVQHTKRAESKGAVGRVCLSAVARERVAELFRVEPGAPGFGLVVDDLADDELGEYELAAFNRRAASGLMLDRSPEGLAAAIDEALSLAEPLACYVPPAVLQLLVEGAADRAIAPRIPTVVALFVKLTGPPDRLDQLLPDEEAGLVAGFSRLFALINAAVEARGGILKNATCDRVGSDMLIYFGSPNAHPDEPARAAAAALAIREIVAGAPPVAIGGAPVLTRCRIGLALGPVFNAEIGEPRGRREFNILGDAVNTAARVMGQARDHQILLTSELAELIRDEFACAPLGAVPLKGKAAPVLLFALQDRLAAGAAGPDPASANFQI